MYLVRSGGRWRAAFLASPVGATAGRLQLSALSAVSCISRAHCSAVGYYHDRLGADRAEAASTP
jgi:hypothetical protein